MRCTPSQTIIFKIFFFFLGISTSIKIAVNQKSGKVEITNISNPLLSNSSEPENYAPELVIGIMSMDLTDSMIKSITKKYSSKKFGDFTFENLDPFNTGAEKIKNFLEQTNEFSYFPKSYSKFLTYYKNVHVVPLNMRADRQHLVSLLDSLDAILFTGGSSVFYQDDKAPKQKILIDTPSPSSKDKKVYLQPSPYFETVKALIQKAKEINDSGREFPIWGTCLGFEALILNEAPPDFQFDLFDDIKKTHSIVLTDPNGKPLPNLRRLKKFREQNRNESSKQFNSNKNQNQMKSKNEVTPANVNFTIKPDETKIFETNEKNIDMDLSIQGKQLKIQISDQPSLNLTQINYSEDFGQFMKNQFKGLNDLKIFYYYHHFGFTVESMLQQPSLSENFTILSISDQNDFESEFKSLPDLEFLYRNELVSNIREVIRKDSTSTTYVSSVVHKKYPFYGVQFHPEKPLYDYSNNKWVNHSDEAKINNRYIFL